MDIDSPRAVKPESSLSSEHSSLHDKKSATATSDSVILSLATDDIISVKSFIDWAYTGNVQMTPEREIFHLTIYIFADKVSEAYTNDFIDAFRAYYFNKSTYMNQTSLRRMYQVGLRGTPLARFGLKTIVYASMKWPKEWVKDEKGEKTVVKRGRMGSGGASDVVVTNEGEEKQSLDEWKEEPTLLFDYAQEMIRWAKKAGVDPSSLRGCVFHEHRRGSACRAAVEVK